MKYKQIIKDAWTLTQENKKLIWYFAFLPALLEALVSLVYMTYQAAAFWTSPYLRESANNGPHAFELVAKAVIGIFSNSAGFGVFLVVLVAIILVMYLLLPVFSQGALIQLIAKLKGNHPVTVMEGIGFGFTRFLQLFEYHMVVKTFSFVGILTEASFAFRNLGPDAFAFFVWIFIFFLVVGFILTLFFTYSQFYIVIDKKGVFQSMMASGGLVVRQWQHTLFMLFLMVLIWLRIIINMLIVLLIPAIIAGSIALFATFTMAQVGIVVGVLLGSVALFFASYFLGVFHVFANSVWTFTFLELTNEDQVDLRSLAQGQHHQE